MLGVSVRVDGPRGHSQSSPKPGGHVAQNGRLGGESKGRGTAREARMFALQNLRTNATIHLPQKASISSSGAVIAFPTTETRNEKSSRRYSISQGTHRLSVRQNSLWFILQLRTWGWRHRMHHFQVFGCTVPTNLADGTMKTECR